MPRCLVSLGSNVGDRLATLEAAAKALPSTGIGGGLRLSGLHETEPVGGPTGQPPFLNQAAVFETPLAPAELLAVLQRVEASHARNRQARWDARSLDLDLLLYDDRIVREPALRVPHPRMTFRPFVLEPACEVAGDWRHPECDATLAELRNALLNGDDAVRIVGDDPALLSQIEAARPGLRRSDAPAARLTIDARTNPWPLPPSGPRLVLADCPTEHIADEVHAALACVWPEPR